MSPRTASEQRHHRTSPRITVRTYVTPTSGAEIHYLSWAMWRYCTRFPEEVGLADLVATSHKRLGRMDGIPLEAS